jgi:hypothetical protein
MADVPRDDVFECDNCGREFPMEEVGYCGPLDRTVSWHGRFVRWSTLCCDCVSESVEDE